MFETLHGASLFCLKILYYRLLQALNYLTMGVHRFDDFVLLLFNVSDGFVCLEVCLLCT